MKNKTLKFFVISLFVLSIVFAVGSQQGTGSGGSETIESGQGTQEDVGQGTQTNTEIVTQNQGDDSQIQIKQQTQTNNPGTGEQVRTQTQSKVQSGNYTTENGKQLQVQEQSNNKIQLRSGVTSAQTSMQMTQEQTQTGTKLQVKLSNGQNAEVKIMPDTASERAMERLQLKTCTSEEGCSIELKEVGQGEQVKAAYEIKTQKEAKVFGLFKTKMQVQAQIDAENGEVIKANKPWWAFLATE